MSLSTVPPPCELQVTVRRAAAAGPSSREREVEHEVIVLSPFCFFCESSLLRNKPQYPTKGHVLHTAAEGGTATEGDFVSALLVKPGRATGHNTSLTPRFRRKMNMAFYWDNNN